MIATGLLWYDDDTRRPVAVKIAEAAQRYRERVGYEPTTCQLNPAQAVLPAPQKHPRKRQGEQPAAALPLRLVPTDTLRPNYFFVGIEEGEPAKRVRGWRADDEEGYSAIVRRPAPAGRAQRSSTPTAATAEASTGTSQVSGVTADTAAASDGSHARPSMRKSRAPSPAASSVLTEATSPSPSAKRQRAKASPTSTPKAQASPTVAEEKRTAPARTAKAGARAATAPASAPAARKRAPVATPASRTASETRTRGRKKAAAAKTPAQRAPQHDPVTAKKPAARAGAVTHAVGQQEKPVRAGASRTRATPVSAGTATTSRRESVTAADVAASKQKASRVAAAASTAKTRRPAKSATPAARRQATAARKAAAPPAPAPAPTPIVRERDGAPHAARKGRAVATGSRSKTTQEEVQSPTARTPRAISPRPVRAKAAPTPKPTAAAAQSTLWGEPVAITARAGRKRASA